MTQPFLISEAVWIQTKDGDPQALALFRRHYSYNVRRDQFSLFPARNRNMKHFVGPGEKMVLLTAAADALFVWRKFISGDGQRGVNCAVFRNESVMRASDLIREASELAWKRWPGERLYTYVNSQKIRRMRQPGRSFLKAGWRYQTGEDGKPYRTKWDRLFVLEIEPVEKASNTTAGAPRFSAEISETAVGIDNPCDFNGSLVGADSDAR